MWLDWTKPLWKIPLVQLPQKFKDGIPVVTGCPNSFPLVQLPQKFKGLKVARERQCAVFPLVQLPQKFKEDLHNQLMTDAQVSISSTSAEVQRIPNPIPKVPKPVSISSTSAEVQSAAAARTESATLRVSISSTSAEVQSPKPKTGPRCIVVFPLVQLPQKFKDFLYSSWPGTQGNVSISSTSAEVQRIRMRWVWYAMASFH